MDTANIKTGTIRQIHQQLLKNGYLVSECALRRWVKQGLLPAAYSGTKALISYDRVVELLNIAPAVMAG